MGDMLEGCTDREWVSDLPKAAGMVNSPFLSFRTVAVIYIAAVHPVHVMVPPLKYCPSLPFHRSNPDKPVISSECCSCQSQRGEDYFNATQGIVYAHVENQAQCMARCMSLSYPYWKDTPSPTMGVIAGTLGVWTLFDYGGEPGPWPTVSSSFGQFDLAGFAKSAAYWYRANWLARVPQEDAGRPPLPAQHVVRISQGWSTPPPNVSWPPVPMPPTCNYTALQDTCPSAPGPDPKNTAFTNCINCVRKHNRTAKTLGCMGKNVWPDYCHAVGPGFPDRSGLVDVQVFSDTPQVELVLNSRSLGIKPCPAFNNANFENVKYAAGNLTAVGRDASGKELARHTILTAGPAAAIVLSLDTPSPTTGTGTALVLDGHDAALVRATVVDANGLTVATADPVVTFLVLHGPARVAGVHNGDAKSHEAQAATSRHAYHGLVRAVVKVWGYLLPLSSARDTTNLNAR